MAQLTFSVRHESIAEGKFHFQWWALTDVNYMCEAFWLMVPVSFKILIFI